MKKIVKVMAVLSMVLAWPPLLSAQDRGNMGAPVEFYGCTWQEGKGLEDLVAVGKRFNKWADKNGSKYSAWILTPQFQTDMGFDVGWLGAWPTGAEMGKTLDAWKQSGHQLAREFFEVIDCRQQHELATSVQLNVADEPPGDGLVMFAGCHVDDGKTGEDAVAAHKKVAAMMKEKGSQASSWAFFPGVGGADDGYDYWQVVAFSSYSDFGAASDLWVNGGGWRASVDVLRGTTHCGRGVMFEVTLVRNGNQ